MWGRAGRRDRAELANHIFSARPLQRRLPASNWWLYHLVSTFQFIARIAIIALRLLEKSPSMEDPAYSRGWT